MQEEINFFEQIQKEVNKALREDEDRKIDYLLTGEIPKKFRCKFCGYPKQSSGRLSVSCTC